MLAKLCYVVWVKGSPKMFCGAGWLVGERWALGGMKDQSRWQALDATRLICQYSGLPIPGKGPNTASALAAFWSMRQGRCREPTSVAPVQYLASAAPVDVLPGIIMRAWLCSQTSIKHTKGTATPGQRSLRVPVAWRSCVTCVDCHRRSV